MQNTRLLADSPARRLPGLLLVAALALAVGACPGSDYDDAGLLSNAGVDWRDEVIYQLMTDRFYDGDPNNNYNVDVNSPNDYHGGDWQGVIDKLPYLQALGVTALWVSPVVKNVEEDIGNASYHGYWTQDFLSCNPHFGDIAKLREMVDAAHNAGIKVICDIVCNHVGQLFYYDINLNGSPEILTSGSTSDPWSTATYPPEGTLSEYDPPYYNPQVPSKVGNYILGDAPIEFFDWPALNRVPPQPPAFQNPEWYHRRGAVTTWNAEQTLYGDFPGGLKDLATERADVRAALIDVFRYWIEAVDFDGFRIDTVKHVEDGFWVEFCPAMRQAAAARGKQNFFLFGEAFDGDDTLLRSFCEPNMLDSVFNFSNKYTVIEGVLATGGATSTIETFLNGQRANYNGAAQPGGIGVAPRDCLVNFIDNHDVPRYLSQNSASELSLALGYIFTIPGVPCVYYGTEQGFDGAADPLNREDLWDAGFSTGNFYYQEVQKWTGIRRAEPALRRGDFTVRWSTPRTGSESDAGIFAFERTYGGDRVLVVMNVHPSKTSFTSYGGGDMATGFSAGTVLSDRNDPSFTYTVTGSTVSISVPPLSVRVLVGP